MAVEVRGLRDWDEYERMLETVAAGFGHEVEAVRRRFERHPPYKLQATRVTIVDGFIASVVHVHELPVRGRAGAAWLMAGIGEVSSHPDYRHKGYATTAMRDAIAYMERVGCNFSMLGTGIAPFYERLGWRSYPRTYLTFDPEQVQLPVPSGVEGPEERFHPLPLPRGEGRGEGDIEVREVDWDADLPDLKRIYREYNRDKVGPLIRSDEYWREATSPRRRSGSSWIASRPGDPVAYLWGAAELRILELAYLDGEEYTARELLLHALRVARKESFKRVVLDEAISPQARELAREQPEGAVSRSESGNTMLRPVAAGFPVDFAPGELIYYGTDGF